MLFSKVIRSIVAESVTLFCLNTYVSQTSLFRHACWHPWMMFFMQCLKVTLPHKQCFERGTGDIPSVILLHNSPTGFSWCPARKTMAEEFSCFKTPNRKTKCKEGFSVCLVSGGCFWQNCHFKLSHTRTRTEQTALDLSPCFFFGVSQKIIIPLSELIKVILRKTSGGRKRWLHPFHC